MTYLPRFSAARGRALALVALALAMAGCPGSPQGVRETVARVHASTAPGDAASARAPSEGGGGVGLPALPSQPYQPPPVGARPSGALAAGTGSVTLSSEVHETPLPRYSPAYTFSNQGLYAGPFTLPTGGPLVVHATIKMDDPSLRSVVHLDTADSVTKHLLFEGVGSYTATFSLPKLSGSYAFYLQLTPVSACHWTLQVYGPPPSPTPSADGQASGPASPGASGSTDPATASASPTSTSKPSTTPATSDPLGDPTPDGGRV